MNQILSMAVLLAFMGSPALAEGESYLVKQQWVDEQKAVIATVESVHEVQARTRIGGVISSIFVKEGDPVTSNARIAVVGDQKLAIRAKGFEADIQAAQSSFEKAKLDYARAEELRKTGYGTQAKLDEARNNLSIAANNLKASEAKRQEVTQQSSEGVILAPSAGRVLKIPVAVGSVVMPGETIATLSQEGYILRLELPERHARFLNPGDKVIIGSRGLQAGLNETKTGLVRLVYPAIKEGRVIADVTAPDLGNYFVGERTLVYISTGKRAAFLIPTSFVFQRAGIHFVKLKSGTEIVVQPGQRQGDQIEILSGLTDGDEVVKP